jgi:hypothetical protein
MLLVEYNLVVPCPHGFRSVEGLPYSKPTRYCLSHRRTLSLSHRRTMTEISGSLLIYQIFKEIVEEKFNILSSP